MWMLGVRQGDYNESHVSGRKLLHNYIQPLNTLETWLKLDMPRPFEICVLIQHKQIIRFGSSRRVKSEIEKGKKSVWARKRVWIIHGQNSSLRKAAESASRMLQETAKLQVKSNWWPLGRGGCGEGSIAVLLSVASNDMYKPTETTILLNEIP